SRGPEPALRCGAGSNLQRRCCQPDEREVVMSPAIATLLTDFGTADTYVAQMKGVMLGIDPTLRLVDLTHDIPPQDILEGAFQLATAIEAFPPGTVHLAVVDPGVGTERRAVAVRTRQAVFVAPDNGVLSF